jgi:hypothetical protein
MARDARPKMLKFGGLRRHEFCSGLIEMRVTRHIARRAFRTARTSVAALVAIACGGSNPSWTGGSGDGGTDVATPDGSAEATTAVPATDGAAPDAAGD